MKAGVLTSPCGRISTPRRAQPSSERTENFNRADFSSSIECYPTLCAPAMFSGVSRSIATRGTTSLPYHGKTGRQCAALTDGHTGSYFPPTAGLARRTGGNNGSEPVSYNIKTLGVISAIVLSLGLATPSAFAGDTPDKKSGKTIVLTGDHAGEGTLGLDTENRGSQYH